MAWWIKPATWLAEIALGKVLDKAWKAFQDMRREKQVQALHYLEVRDKDNAETERAIKRRKKIDEAIARVGNADRRERLRRDYGRGE